jgi:hypothetical protein
LLAEKALKRQSSKSLLGESIRKLIAEVHEKAEKAVDQEALSSGDTLLTRLASENIDSLSEKERAVLATDLMLERNKVTHIYELVKAYGSEPQVAFNRKTHEWQRTPAIALKHAREYSVSPISGHYGTGEIHAPLIYADDPRKNLPSKLRQHLSETLKGRDPSIVEGWIKAVVSPTTKDTGLG